MTDLLHRSQQCFVATVTVDGNAIDLGDAVFGSATEAIEALGGVLDRMIESGMQAKNLNLLAEGGWTGRFRHYGGSEESSVWSATYRELSIDE